jgi:hypothetical protein
VPVTVLCGPQPLAGYRLEAVEQEELIISERVAAEARALFTMRSIAQVERHGVVLRARMETVWKTHLVSAGCANSTVSLELAERTAR